jgi:hypothetical protein
MKRGGRRDFGIVIGIGWLIFGVLLPYIHYRM